MKIFNSKGILGINARNLLYIKPFNPKKAIQLADNKIKTKKFLAARGIPVPKLINTITTREEAEAFNFDSLPNQFVLKPNCGFGGEGIIPIANKKDGYFITVNGDKVTKQEMLDQIIDILDGRFSIASASDTAFFEQLLIADKSVGAYSYEGLPDVRIIVYNLIPVMAMLRLPTKESKGKANLHQGAVGVGIDIGSGKATYIARRNKIIEEIPGFGRVDNLKIPFWDEILLMASKIQLATNLGYLAADIAVDKNSGPVILEINARAGLGVQIANLAPLQKRLERIKGIRVTTPEKAVQIAKDMFGRIVERKAEAAPAKQIIGKKEEVELILKKGIKKIKAAIDSSVERTIFDVDLAKELNLLDSDDYNDEKSTLKLKFSLKESRIATIVDLENITGDCKLVIGTRDLNNFLIDPTIKHIERSEDGAGGASQRAPTHHIKRAKKIKNNFEIDQEITNIDNKLKLLFHLRPSNLKEEREKFFKDFNYNPQFTYPQIQFDPSNLKDKLEKLETDDSPIGLLFAAKKEELIKKIELIESVDTDDLTQKSENLFGVPDEELLKECETILMETDKLKNKDEANIDASEAKNRFEEIFVKYGLHDWKVKIKDELVTDCVAGKASRLLLRKDAKFSESRLESLIVHEIETHILTAENGSHQPFGILNRGTANYLITQEGLAIYNVTKHLNKSIGDSFKALALVVAINTALSDSFVKVFEKMLSYGISIEDAFRVTLKVKRGLGDTSRPGAFTKDLIYFKGYKEIVEFVENGGDIKDLYLGKINHKDIEVIKKIKGLNKPKYLPKWL